MLMHGLVVLATASPSAAIPFGHFLLLFHTFQTPRRSRMCKSTHQHQTGSWLVPLTTLLTTT